MQYDSEKVKNKGQKNAKSSIFTALNKTCFKDSLFSIKISNSLNNCSTWHSTCSLNPPAQVIQACKIIKQGPKFNNLIISKSRLGGRGVGGGERTHRLCCAVVRASALATNDLKIQFPVKFRYPSYRFDPRPMQEATN